MSSTKPLPAALKGWAEQRIGPVVSVRDASHDWDRSRVWDLEGERGVHHYLKVSPSVKFFTRESRAYRHIVPALGHTRARHLIDSRAQDLVLLLTAVPGAPAKELGLGAVEWRTVHQQAGALCARLHEAGELDRDDRVEAEASLSAAADGAEKYLASAGDRLNQDEQHLIRDHAARLRRARPVPVGYIHPRSCVGIPAFRPGGKRILRFGAAKRRSTLRSCSSSGQGLAVMRPSAVK
ncbi:aminoglycoside phosphotransferase [Streptomyces sp. NPDC002917]|uniref:aminoglycoside phosphotransferase n=1 Tax=Streptomyces sp. NPDC002917 TaxID=3364671 RepID=UPI00369DB0B0